MGHAILKNKDKNAQVALESCLVVATSIILLLGMNAIWAWSNNNIAERQPDYNATRLEAGSSSPGRWINYAQRPLTEEWIFAAVPAADAPENLAAETRGSRQARTEHALAASEKEAQASENIKQAATLDYEAEELEEEAAALEQEAQALDGESWMSFSYYDYGWNWQAFYQGLMYQANEKRQLAQDKRDEADQLEADAEQLLDEAIEIREDSWQT